jgi:hypothetical protein
MPSPQFDAAVTRDTIIKLLTDDENAKVSNVEDGHTYSGDYIDLENLGQGVQTGEIPTGGSGNVLPKSAVNPETWNKIVAMVSRG